MNRQFLSSSTLLSFYCTPLWVLGPLPFQRDSDKTLFFLIQPRTCVIFLLSKGLLNYFYRDRHNALLEDLKEHPTNITKVIEKVLLLRKLSFLDDNNVRNLPRLQRKVVNHKSREVTKLEG